MQMDVPCDSQIEGTVKCSKCIKQGLQDNQLQQRRKSTAAQTAAANRIDQCDRHTGWTAVNDALHPK
jgi:hypothetical protein